MMLISIITVVLNDKSGLQTTIDSIDGQSYKSYEHIIWDGGSTDGTFEIATSSTPNNRFVKQGKDTGIYDAMNQALDLISDKSDYVVFLNAGDTFCSASTLTEVVSSLDKFDVLVGNFSIIDNLTGRLTPRIVTKDIQKLEKLMPYCHQSIYIKTSIIKLNKFDTKYSLAADYKQLLILYKQGCSFHISNDFYSNFLNGGACNISKVKVRNEFISIQNEVLGGFSKLLMIENFVQPLVNFIKRKYKS